MPRQRRLVCRRGSLLLVLYGVPRVGRPRARRQEPIGKRPEAGAQHLRTPPPQPRQHGREQPQDGALGAGLRVRGQHAQDHHHYLPCARDRGDAGQQLRGDLALLRGKRAGGDGNQRLEELEAVLIEGLGSRTCRREQASAEGTQGRGHLGRIR
jgi:hypothetical protein